MVQDHNYETVSGTPMKAAMKSSKKVHFNASTSGKSGKEGTTTAGTAATTTTTGKEREASAPPVTTEANIQLGPAPSAPGLFIHTSDNPSAALGSSHGTSTLNSAFPNHNSNTPNNHTQYYGNSATPHLASHIQPLQAANYFGNIPGAVASNTTYIGNINPYIKPGFNHVARMADDYQNAVPPVQGALHFQPPVPDTTYGPMLHRYIPRMDGPQFMVAPGQAHLPQQHIIVQQPGQAQGYAPVINQAPFGYGGVRVVAGQGQPPIVMPAGPPPPPGAAPVFVNGQFAMPGAGGPVHGQVYLGPGGIPIAGPGGAPAPFPIPGTVGLPPDVTGVGRTVAEVQAQQAQYAAQNNMNEPEDFQPRPSSPSRMYWCRELDGNWTQRTRCTIDQMGDQEWRWYQTPEGLFYAVRLPS